MQTRRGQSNRQPENPSWHEDVAQSPVGCSPATATLSSKGKVESPLRGKSFDSSSRAQRSSPESLRRWTHLRPVYPLASFISLFLFPHTRYLPIPLSFPPSPACLPAYLRDTSPEVIISSSSSRGHLLLRLSYPQQQIFLLIFLCRSSRTRAISSAGNCQPPCAAIERTRARINASAVTAAVEAKVLSSVADLRAIRSQRTVRGQFSTFFRTRTSIAHSPRSIFPLIYSCATVDRLVDPSINRSIDRLQIGLCEAHLPD